MNNQNYCLSSILFLLTVHDISRTHAKQLDSFTHTCLKRWAGLPPSAANLVIHMMVALDITKSVTLYHTCQSLSHPSIRLKGGTIVNVAINRAISKESERSQKKSTIIAAETVKSKIFSDTLHWRNKINILTPAQAE